MNPVLFCLSLLLLFSATATLLFVAASMNSSRISQVEDGYEPEPSYHGHPVSVQSKDIIL